MRVPVQASREPTTMHGRLEHATRPFCASLLSGRPGIGLGGTIIRRSQVSRRNLPVQSPRVLHHEASSRMGSNGLVDGAGLRYAVYGGMPVSKISVIVGLRAFRDVRHTSPSSGMAKELVRTPRVSYAFGEVDVMK